MTTSNFIYTHILCIWAKPSTKLQAMLWQEKQYSRSGVFNPRPAGHLRPGKGTSQNTMRYEFEAWVTRPRHIVSLLGDVTSATTVAHNVTMTSDYMFW